MENKAWSRLQVLVFYLKSKLWWMRCFLADLSSSPSLLPLSSPSISDSPPRSVRWGSASVWFSGGSEKLRDHSFLFPCSAVWWAAQRKCPGRFMDPAELLLSPPLSLSLSICIFLVIFLSPGLISTIIKLSLLHFRLTLSLPEYHVLVEEASLHLTCL